MKLNHLYLSFIFLITVSCQAQEHPAESKSGIIQIGGPCEGCDLMYAGIPDVLNQVDTCFAWADEEPRLHISGRILQPDGKSPAANVILYYYHTDMYGRYSHHEEGNKSGGRHGARRGWVKTGPDGRYDIFTIRPAAYPNASIPAHIHAIIKEPGYSEYYISDYFFDNDPLLSDRDRNRQRWRGGNGILKTHTRNGVLIAQRDIILRKNL